MQFGFVVILAFGKGCQRLHRGVLHADVAALMFQAELDRACKGTDDLFLQHPDLLVRVDYQLPVLLRRVHALGAQTLHYVEWPA